MTFIGILGAVVLVAVLALTVARVNVARETAEDRVVGTTGTLPDEDTSGVVHELETITGTNDGHELVGRRVELHVPVQAHVNDVAFWVGSRDNRVLVVLARDTRDGVARQKGQPSASGLDSEAQRNLVAISGTVDRLPAAEQRYSWSLTEADDAALKDRPIYIRADTVTPHYSAGTP